MTITTMAIHSMTQKKLERQKIVMKVGTQKVMKMGKVMKVSPQNWKVKLKVVLHLLTASLTHL